MLLWQVHSYHINNTKLKTKLVTKSQNIVTTWRATLIVTLKWGKRTAKNLKMVLIALHAFRYVSI